MNTVSSKIHTPTIQRATFLAVWQALMSFFLFMSGGSLFLSTGISVVSIATLLGAVTMLGIAGSTYFKPESLRWGTDPTPRSWLLISAVALILWLALVLLLVLDIVVAL